MSSDENWTTIEKKGTSKNTQRQLEKAMTIDEWRVHCDAYRRSAEQYRDQVLKSHTPQPGQRTVCYMATAKVGGGITWETGVSSEMGGNKGHIETNRDSGAIISKKTVCAEEHILAEHPKVNFMFSFAFDEHGLKPACKNCSKLLRDRQIQDICGK